MDHMVKKKNKKKSQVGPNCMGDRIMPRVRTARSDSKLTIGGQRGDERDEQLGREISQ